MKTIEETLFDVAKVNGYDSFEDFLNDAWLDPEIMGEAIKQAFNEHAKQVAEAQREACAKNATARAVYSSDNDGTYDGVVNKSSILNTPLVTDNI